MRKPKYKIGDKVEVCGCLNTVIESIKYSDKYQDYECHFKDSVGNLFIELESSVVFTKR